MSKLTDESFMEGVETAVKGVIVGMTEHGENYIDSMALDQPTTGWCHSRSSCPSCLMRMLLMLVQPTTLTTPEQREDRSESRGENKHPR